ncbi:MAG: hypothetical protein M1133_05475 [Armatimonadetes bacterium]|nr:hypothetical protein [Armatimonadota bacterium]
MRRRIPGKSLFASKAHFLKAGPHELGKRAGAKRRRKANRLQERRAERGETD